MERNQVHNNKNGYSIRTVKLLEFLKKRHFTLSDIATKIGISEREMEERLDDWDYWNAEEIEKIVDFVGAEWILKILDLRRQERKRLQQKVFFWGGINGRNEKIKR